MLGKTTLCGTFLLCRENQCFSRLRSVQPNLTHYADGFQIMTLYHVSRPPGEHKDKFYNYAVHLKTCTK